MTILIQMRLHFTYFDMKLKIKEDPLQRKITKIGMLIKFVQLQQYTVHTYIYCIQYSSGRTVAPIYLHMLLRLLDPRPFLVFCSGIVLYHNTKHVHNIPTFCTFSTLQGLQTLDPIIEYEHKPRIHGSVSRTSTRIMNTF